METNIIKQSARGYESLSVTDVLFSERKIFLTGEITPELCNDAIKSLMCLDKESDNEIVIYINSPGGSVNDGLALYDAIRMLRSPVRTVCMGIAASMGAILFLSGDQRFILPKSEVMIHDPSYGGGRYTGQKPAEIQKHLDSLVKKRDLLCGIIADRTGMSLKEVRRKTSTDFFFTAEEAIAAGIATQIAETLD